MDLAARTGDAAGWSTKESKRSTRAAQAQSEKSACAALVIQGCDQGLRSIWGFGNYEVILEFFSRDNWNSPSSTRREEGAFIQVGPAILPERSRTRTGYS